MALSFASTPEGRQPRLLSAGAEPDPREPRRQRLVLRLWDVNQRTELDRTAAGEFRGMRPWLAAWSVAPEHARIRAAAAWTDSSFLVWDAGVSPPRQVADPHGGRTILLSYLPGPGRLLTGHFGRPTEGRFPEGYLDSWDEAAPTVPIRSNVVSWAAGRPIPPDIKGMPVAQVPVSSRPGGPPDLLAVVAQSWAPPDGSGALEYRLQLLDLAPGRFGTVRAQAALWSGPRVQPFVASWPGSGWLAIVGNPDDEILVQTVADLLQDKPQLQKLHGVGEPIGTAAFVRKGADEWGLRMGRTPQASPDDLVLDLTNRRLSASPGDWALATAGSDDWQTFLVRPTQVGGPPDRPTFSPWILWIYRRRDVFGPGIRVIPDRQSAGNEVVEVTAHAMLPPGRAPVPIAAIAAVEPMVGPTLSLYNGRTGERFRQLSGHTGTIRSLAFSQDGRFLVSSAGDRTACIWSLTDLDQILARRGALPGLVLARHGGRTVVTDILRGSPYAGRVDLGVGDIVEGYVEPRGGLRELGSAFDIHFAMATRPPGQTVTLRRRRDGQVAQDVPLVLGQAIDERKPLLTLFVAREGPDKPLEWLGWSPFGPYDSSGPGVASLFGWHFNAPDRPEAPARFALATGYPMFRREGLLRDLIREGRLPPTPAPVPLEPPDMQLLLEPDGQPHGDLILVREPPALLGLELDDRVTPERIESVKWRFDQGEFRSMRFDEGSWTVNLSEANIAWDREPHELTVEVRTRGADPRTFSRRRKVRYLPRPPRLRPLIPRGIAGLQVDQRRFRFEADVEPTGDNKARARLICRHGEEVLRQAEYGPNFNAMPHIAEMIELKPGDNTIELEVVNEGARDDLKEEETERFGPLTVHYSPKPVSRPIITLDSLALLPEGQGTPSGTIKVMVREPCVVDTTTRVRLLGRITARDKLRRVERRSAGEDWKAVDGFDAKSTGEVFDFKEEIDLAANRQVIYFRAQAVDSDAQEATSVEPLIVECHPPLPSLERLTADPPGPLVRFGSGGSEPDPVRLRASIRGVPGRIEQALALLNGERAAELRVDVESKEVSGTVKFPRGKNEITILLSNRWHAARFGPIVLEYRRPPEVEQWDARLLERRSFATISARVGSLTALTRAEVEVVPRSGDAPAARTYPLRRERLAEGAWAVIAEVPVEQGENEVILRTWNEDGESPAKTTRLFYEKPVEPKPVVIVETAEKGTLGRPIAPLRFRVRSASPLARVELVLDRSSSRATVENFAVDRLVPGLDGTYEFRVDREIELEPGPNAFKLVAVNAGGDWSGDLLFTYTPPPIRVAIDEVKPRGGGGKSLHPRGRAGGPPVLPEPLPDGAIVLSGRVIWTDSDSMGKYRDPRLQVWINGFPHIAVPLEEPVADDPLARHFRAEVLLSRLEDNEIDLRLGGAPLDLQGDHKLLASCREVKTNWRLHLLVIGVGTVDRRELLDRAIAGLRGREFNADDGTFKTPAFPTATLYGFTSQDNDIHRLSVQGRLAKIRRAITLRPTRPSNDIVIVYYQGGDVIYQEEGDVRGREACLRLRPTGLGKNDIIRLSEIRKALGETPDGSQETRGVKLFLLDVTRATGQVPLILAQAAQWIEDDSPYGLLRFSWQGQPAPPDASLASTLRDTLREKTTLEEVSAEVEKRSRSLRDRYPSLRYLPELTRHFNSLVLGGP